MVIYTLFLIWFLFYEINEVEKYRICGECDDYEKCYKGRRKSEFTHETPACDDFKEIKGGD